MELEMKIVIDSSILFQSEGILTLYKREN